MVFGFIKQSQGYIRIANRKSGGAKISLLLPLLTYKKEPNSNPTSHVAEKVEKETNFSNKLMLLVEDDHDVRAIIREQLISFGLNVIEANDSHEAEQLINTINDLYGMVSDISMPGNKDGFELAALLKSHSPNCKIVLMSGYFQQHHKPNEDAPILLKKPFVANKLFQALQ